MKSLSVIRIALLFILIVLGLVTGIGSHTVFVQSSVQKRILESPPKDWSAEYIVDQKRRADENDWISNLLLNFSAGMLSSAITLVLISYILERLQRDYYDRRDARDRMTRLVQLVRSGDNAVALRAIDELRASGALQDGSLTDIDFTGAKLVGSNLRGAMLRGAILTRVDLQSVTLVGADLSGANLQGASLDYAVATSCVFEGANFRDTSFCASELDGANLNKVQRLSEEQLRQAGALCGAIMPDGSQYTGRFELWGDREAATRSGLDYSDPIVRARFYSTQKPRDR